MGLGILASKAFEAALLEIREVSWRKVRFSDYFHRNKRLCLRRTFHRQKLQLTACKLCRFLCFWPKDIFGLGWKGWLDHVKDSLPRGGSLHNRGEGNLEGVILPTPSIRTQTIQSCRQCSNPLTPFSLSQIKRGISPGKARFPLIDLELQAAGSEVPKGTEVRILLPAGFGISKSFEEKQEGPYFQRQGFNLVRHLKDSN